jgi:hypothetical protein
LHIAPATSSPQQAALNYALLSLLRSSRLLSTICLALATSKCCSTPFDSSYPSLESSGISSSYCPTSTSSDPHLLPNLFLLERILIVINNSDPTLEMKFPLDWCTLNGPFMSSLYPHSLFLRRSPHSVHLGCNFHSSTPTCFLIYYSPRMAPGHTPSLIYLIPPSRLDECIPYRTEENNG